MKESSKGNSIQEKNDSKKAYQSPKFTVYGSLDGLTNAKSGTRADGASANKKGTGL
jgi:hypothetical protein